jgi:lysophospholipase L1-like esterase
VPLPEFKANMEAMIKKLKSKGIRNIIVMTPPPVVDRMVRKSDGTLAPTPKQADMKQYSAAAVAVAAQQGVPSVDVFNIIQKFNNWQVCCLAAWYRA